MLEEVVTDYAAYLTIDVSSSFKSVQNVIDNILTRLEELISVLQMIKLKNGDCNLAVTDELSKYRSEITILSKKVATIMEVINQLQSNVDIIEKQVEKAEIDFAVSNDNKIKSFLKPFLSRNKAAVVDSHMLKIPTDLKFQSVLDNFE